MFLSFVCTDHRSLLMRLALSTEARPFPRHNIPAGGSIKSWPRLGCPLRRIQSDQCHAITTHRNTSHTAQVWYSKSSRERESTARLGLVARLPFRRDDQDDRPG